MKQKRARPAKAELRAVMYASSLSGSLQAQFVTCSNGEVWARSCRQAGGETLSECIAANGGAGLQESEAAASRG